jgi:hypothetical protein
MHERCRDPKHPAFHRYGGRGIAVCERWWKFENFLADLGERPEGKTLDRFPNNGGNYEPGNCRWATVYEQQSNRGDSRYITARGRAFTVAEWSRRTELTESVIRQRLDRGDEGEEALRPLTSPKRITVKGKKQTIAELAASLGLTVQAIYQRIRKGLDPNAPRMQ